MRVMVDGIIFKLNPGGGIGRYWTETLKAILRLDPNLRFDVVLHRGTKRPSGLPCQTAWGIPFLLNAWKADLFHTSYYTEWPRLKIPSIVTAYDCIDASFPFLQPNGSDFVARQVKLIQRAAAVITISRHVQTLISEFTCVPPEEIFVAYPAVSAPFSDPIPPPDEIHEFRQAHTGGAPYLLHVGMRKNYKNFRTILKAFCRAAKNTARHLMIVGGKKHAFGEEEMDLVISTRMLDRIHYYPRLDDSMLRLAYAGADAMVHASLMEGFGIPVIEALACGTGLILSDIPVYREIAEGRARFVEPSSVEDWEQAMKEPIPVHPSWRESVLQQYTWEKAARSHLAAYASVMQ